MVGLIPFIGSLASALWPMALMAIASIHVHRSNEKNSWAVFGALAAFLVVMNLGAERAANDMAGDLENLRRMMEEQQQ